MDFLLTYVLSTYYSDCLFISTFYYTIITGPLSNRKVARSKL